MNAVQSAADRMVNKEDAQLVRKSADDCFAGSDDSAEHHRE
jgi:hypothetical protein